ncbi:HAMP domain-containing histidine kinase [Chryseobacterium indologenes]|uniref:sensor histidine kinase n=1 Tax=Chryseobacterium indologenes TaxID=253 RepID=UPI0003E0641D|nr:HAMP domain-containing sensor histidine kinase [Chryseobacterium indologenes]QPQ50895.1 HAMP domain-containing histidine kinase [Chryseobacterium indologenes]GAE63330.1 putative two-component histidine kinase [Chryseobacterium indologenes NBRC 14944]SFJ13178.1 Histidine kinase-, DNA gyrase B-, and HSP90-like ATPase [Chryseobacterium indologenes]SUX49213.1 Autoinducer 2 sensor kinase/phosphatase luxQ [Chryseobacterium indologenes]
MAYKFLNFKLRKIVHYSLILCILLIQGIIAIFFYNEFVNEKKLKFIKTQLEESRALGGLTDNSRKDFMDAQDHLQKYMINQDNKELDLYFQSLRKLKNNFDKIGEYEKASPRLKNTLAKQKIDTLKVTRLKSLMDSVYKTSLKPPVKMDEKPYEPEKYKNNFENLNIQTRTYADTIKKKGFMGRLKDAITGKVNVQKESTVVTLTNNKTVDLSNLKSEVSNVMKSMDKHYAAEVKKVQLYAARNQRNNIQFYSNFSKLLVYSNGLIDVYENAIRDFKSELEKEYSKQSSANNKIRTYLVLGLMVLMFIVSILIMYFTRVAFIYERKLNAENEEIKNNLSFKNRILGMLSHDLRSPLKIINIFIDKIYRTTDDETIKDYLKSIKFTNSTLLLQSNQILEYTKNQDAEKKLINTVFNLKDEISSIVKVITPYIETRNNKFVVTDRIPEGTMVNSDSIRMNQIFMNILGNANKFTENGQIDLTMITETIGEHKIAFTTTVADTGIGISESDLKKIFEPYYQGTVSDEVDNLGAGLGLNLCKEIVELFDGDISISSKLHKGTKITFKLILNTNNNGVTN